MKIRVIIPCFNEGEVVLKTYDKLTEIMSEDSSVKNYEYDLLFIDDDNFLRKVYDSELRENGYEVILAADGKEGVNKAKLEKPDLVVHTGDIIDWASSPASEAMNELYGVSIKNNIKWIINTGKMV